jgi:predicted Zn-dependent peptidase
MSSTSYKITKLDNGLPVIYLEMPNTETIYMSIMIRVGSINEPENILGISHVLEHMLFKQNKKYPSKLKLYQALDELGANYNAFTVYNVTSFYIKTHASFYKKVVEIFSSMILEPHFDEKEYKLERDVIIEEIRATYDDPSDVSIVTLYKHVFKGTPLEKPIAGTIASVKAISIHDIKHHMKCFYKVDNMVLSIAGKLPPHFKNVLNKSAFALSNLTPSKHVKFIPLPKEMHFKQTGPHLHIVHLAVNQQLCLNIGFPTEEGMFHQNRYIYDLIELILARSMSSRLFMRLREKEGLVYGVSSYISRHESCSIFIISTTFKKHNYIPVLTAILDELRVLMTQLVSQTELNVWKNYNKSVISMSSENMGFLSNYYARQYLFYGHDHIITPKQYNEIVSKITPEQIHNVCVTLFKKTNMNIVLTGDVDKSKLQIKTQTEELLA